MTIGFADRVSTITAAWARIALFTALAIAALALLAADARAAYPGVNGTLVVSECLPCDPDLPSRVWTLEPGGSDRTQILGELDYDPVFSGSGERISFTRRDGKGAIPNTVNLYTSNPDGSDVQQVTDFPASSFDSDLSANGKRIVFTSPRVIEDNALNYDIYIANSDGSGVQRLTTAQAYDSFPAFSPDDRSIVFTSERDGGDAEVYVMDVDGSDQTRLTDSPDFDDNPEYSPDGSKIIFRTRRNGGQSDLYTMNADGSNEQPVIASPDQSELRGVYSPDGEQIAFAASPLDTPEVEFDVFTAAADGSGIANVTNTPEINERNLDWQPIPNRIARTCGEPYPNLLGGTGAADQLTGGRLADAIRARGGDDTVSGRKLGDCLYGGAGGDTLKGKGGDDGLRGGGGDDSLRGAAGDDRLLGGRGDDVLRGGAGANTINCGAGSDRVVVSDGARDEVRGNCEEVVRR